MAERLNAAVLKTVVGLRPSRVRILPPPGKFGELAERLNAAVSKTVVVVRRPEVQILHSPILLPLMEAISDAGLM